MAHLKILLVVVGVFLSFFLPSSHAAMPPSNEANAPAVNEIAAHIAHRISPDEVPESLRPWIDWALNDTDANLCPFLTGSESIAICSWSSPLALNVNDTGGTFSVTWRTFEETLVPLPGNEDHWPLDVKAGTVSVAVLESGDQKKPQVLLPKGTFTLTGSFTWNRLPESVDLPPEIGIVQLTLRGTKVDFPNRHEDGSLWLESKEEEAAEGDQATIHVFRHLLDDIPFTMTTEISLEVSGSPRELIVPQVFLKSFIPLSLETQLPSQIENNGTLRIQARAGSWKIRVRSRHHGPINDITREALTGTPMEENPDEIWVFEPRNDLRLVTPQGVPSIDPSQTTLPQEWKKFPAFLVAPGATLHLDESRRGNSGLIPDDLSLHRDLWLDFDGGGYTFKDTLTGTIRESSRLEMSPPIELGQVTLDGQDQLITTLDPTSGKAGVEIRQGSLHEVADSRLEVLRTTVPIPGWDHDFQKVSATLHLSPGWRLFTILGADQVSDTWLNHWTLFDIFLVVVMSLAIGRLWGRRWGGIAALTFVLVYPESGAPQWEFLPLIAILSLMTLIKKEKPAVILQLLRSLGLIFVILVALPYMVEELRRGIYPTLEPLRLADYSPLPTSAKEEGLMAPPPMQMQGAAPEPEMLESYAQNYRSKLLDAKKPVSKKRIMVQQNIVLPGANIQTGPGIPRWHWSDISISWLGPLDRGHKIRVFLISPLINLILSILRVLLLARLILLLLNRPHEDRWSPRRWLPRHVSALVILCLSLLSTSAHASSEFPDSDMLQSLREQLTLSPECFPHCASISRMSLETSSSSLRIRLEVGAATTTAIPLPGARRDWTPDKVVFEGTQKTVESGKLYRDDQGILWVEIPEGTHHLVCEGPLPQKSTVQLPLPLKPHRIETTLQGWSLSGVNKDGVPEEALQLQREESASLVGSPVTGNLPAASLPPLLKVEREIIVGLKWEILTTVQRLSPSSDSVVLKVPLLLGESVTSPGIHVDQGHVTVNLPPQDEEFSWRSTFLESESMTLKASDSPSLIEVWRLNASTLYHVNFEGIPAIHGTSSLDSWLPEWHPWPGESVQLSFLKPQAIPGPTLTIEESSLHLTPGLRYTKATFTVELRSSLGGQHSILLPDGITLEGVSINGSEVPLSVIQGKLTLPLTPGVQKAQIRWQQPTGLRLFFRTPSMDLGLPHVNTQVQFQMPPNRWILATYGPRMGPAVLFWGYVFVLVLVSLGLGRLALDPDPMVPVRTHHWILLGLGLSQVSFAASVLIVGWFLMLGWRRKSPRSTANAFNLLQIILVGLSVAALACLFWSIQHGLLGYPDMQIEGNNSSNNFLQWYQDRSINTLPRPWVLSLPLAGYRIAMLAWALWLAFRLLKWLKWGWECFTTGGSWLKRPPH